MSEQKPGQGSKRQKKRVFVVTGMTPEEVEAHIRTSKFLREIGKRSLEDRRCYLCKKREGEDLFCADFTEDEPQPDIVSISLREYEIEVSEGVAMVYVLCAHCVVLLEGFATREIRRV